MDTNAADATREACPEDLYVVVTSDLNNQGTTYDYYYAKAMWREAIDRDPLAYVIESETGAVVFGDAVAAV